MTILKHIRYLIIDALILRTPMYVLQVNLLAPNLISCHETGMVRCKQINLKSGYDGVAYSYYHNMIN